MNVLTLKTPAKINLGLRIVSKRPDGYHNIESVFKAVEFGDELTFEPQDNSEIVISADQPGVPTDHSNLCFKAATMLRKETGLPIGASIMISKRIPIGGGLGGGSSNAAATLVALNQMHRLNLSDDRLMSLGAEIGSDVPFFVGLQLGRGNTAYVSGRGEIVDFRPLPLSGQVVLVLPGFEISTPWAYANHKNAKMRLTKSQKKGTFLAFKNQDVLRDLYLENDFEDLVFEVHPELEIIAKNLELLGAGFSLMSGSGSTIFGLFADAELPEKEIEQVFGSYKVVITEFAP